MKEVSNTILKVILVPLIVFLFVLGQWLFFYPGSYEAPPTRLPALEEITVPTPLVKSFTDIYERQQGTLILDLAHQNDFYLEELYSPTIRVTSRGYSIDYWEEGSDIAEMLRFADSLAIILPLSPFSPEEIELIEEFVAKGGKLLLIADPTRPSEINTIAAEFGIIFEADYLYNLAEYDANFRNVLFNKQEQFLANEITQGLEGITLYTAGSISSPGWGIVFTDDNTFSSVRESKDRLSPVVLRDDSRILAISDLTFLVDPYNAVMDNNQFISNIADWLTTSERSFFLSDFPYLLEDSLDVSYGDASLIDIGLGLKNFLRDLGKSPGLGQFGDKVTKDTLFIGLFDHADKVEDYLKSGNISITQTVVEAEEETEEEETETAIEIEGIGELTGEGTSIIYLYQDEEKYILLVLSDTEDRLQEVIDGLESGQFRQWLVTDTLGIYQVDVEVEEDES